MSDDGRKNLERGKLYGGKLIVDDVNSGHMHLFNELCKEKRIMNGKGERNVMMQMIWDEAVRVFGFEKTSRMLNDFYLAKD